MELHSVDEVNEVVGLGRGVRVVALWPHVLVTTRPLISSYVFFLVATFGENGCRAMSYWLHCLLDLLKNLLT